MIQLQSLKKGEILALNEQGLSLKISRGQIWLTRAGDNKDYILLDGETLNSELNSQILIQALVDTTIAYSAQTFEFKPDMTQAGVRSTPEAETEMPRSASAR
ncbi:MAG: DUF2917 domain-containing protein [Pseudobdellovibrionaceae bacterium]